MLSGMVKIFIINVFGVSLFSRCGFINIWKKMLVKNFLFHRVSEEIDKQWPPMRPMLFDEIIRTLLKNHKIICLEELLTSPDLRSSKTFATVLFDDGYKDNIEYAAPILKKNNCAASFYVVTDCIDRNIPTWTF